MLELCLQRVVREKSLRKSLLDRGERLNRTTLRQAQASRCNRSVASSRHSIGRRLIEIGKNLQFDSVFADIRDLKGVGVADLPLHREMVALNIAGGQVLGNVSSL